METSSALAQKDPTLNEIPSEQYYTKYLRRTDSQRLKRLVLRVGHILERRMPSGLIAVGSSTWTEQMCQERGLLVPRCYTDIDILVAPQLSIELSAFDRIVRTAAGDVGVYAHLDTMPQRGAAPSGHAHTVKTRLSNGTALDLIIRADTTEGCSIATNLHELIQRERDSTEKRFPFAILYTPKAQQL